MSGECVKNNWRVWQGCQQSVGRLSGGCRCGEAAWMISLSGRCWKAMGRLGEALWRVLGGCLEAVRRLSVVCGQAVWEV